VIGVESIVLRSPIWRLKRHADYNFRAVDTVPAQGFIDLFRNGSRCSAAMLSYMLRLIVDIQVPRGREVDAELVATRFVMAADYCSGTLMRRTFFVMKFDARFVRWGA
jgi:hypothetical protein